MMVTLQQKHFVKQQDEQEVIHATSVIKGTLRAHLEVRLSARPSMWVTSSFLQALDKLFKYHLNSIQQSIQLLPHLNTWQITFVLQKHQAHTTPLVKRLVCDFGSPP